VSRGQIALSILGPNLTRPKTAAQLFAPLTTALGLVTLEIHASPLWASANSDHRKLLHAALDTRIRELGCVLTQSSPYPVSAPENLGLITQEIPRSISISVSHSPTVGGFALLSSREGVIGFDIEDADRVTEKVAKRIEADGEKRPEDLAPELFWAAKEAAYKSLRGPGQPAVLTDLRLAKWAADGAQGYQFQVKVPESIQGLGYALSEKNHVLSLFVQKPST
jgi:phosphopantetheinyl transferase (holo-ACP synthase)